MMVQILIYTVLGALAALTAYAAGTPVYKSSREEPAVKPKERLNASIGD